jgi:hypothetical protein
MLRRFMFAAVAVSAGAMAACPGAALASPVQDPVPIGPNQLFVGLVNGTSSNAVIQMACFGPTRPGQTGHPMAGQTVEVQPNLEGPGGFTGNARRIAARLSSPASTTAGLNLATFSNYFVPAPISTALRFPCFGSGSVAFRPVNGGSKARAAIVEVSFAGQP